tara:strand:+ start:2743 stop:3708 length:966 start_codon:yes stop_codon:yes gene_type:complete
MLGNVCKIGLIGLGKMGQNHLRILLLLKEVELVFIFDSDFKILEKTGKKFNLDISSEIRLNDDLNKVDAVIICTPTITHSEYICRCSKFVKNIFVEKPLASNLKETYDLHKFIVDSNLNVKIGFIERFNPAVQQLKNVILKSKGVVNIDFKRTNKISSRIKDVDVVIDLMIHDIDLALYLNGPFKSIDANGYCNSGMIDFAIAVITHENGRTSRVLASRITDKKMRLIEATCLDMFIDCDLLRKEIVINKQSKTEDNEDKLYSVIAMQESVEVSSQEALLSELQAFIRSTKKDQLIDTSSSLEALNAMKICDKVQKIILGA